MEKDRVDITHEVNEYLEKINDDEAKHFVKNFLEVFDVRLLQNNSHSNH